MNPLIYFFIGGYAFFAGLLFTIFGAVLITSSRNWILRTANIFLLIAAIITAASAAPLPWWLYLMYAVSLLVLLVFRHRQSDPKEMAPRNAAIVLILISLVMVEWECGYIIARPIPFPKEGTLYVLGDSLSIGSDTNEENWPQRLGVHANLPVTNLGFGGATTATALSNAKRIEENARMVIIELGGNDLLNRRSASEFEQGLRAILEASKGANRTLVIVALPLPPGYNRFGTIQRRLAKEYDAYLVPRRILAKVITSDGATTDGLHFSEEGHRRFAEALWNLHSTKVP